MLRTSTGLVQKLLSAITVVSPDSMTVERSIRVGVRVLLSQILDEDVPFLLKF